MVLHFISLHYRAGIGNVETVLSQVACKMSNESSNELL